MSEKRVLRVTYLEPGFGTKLELLASNGRKSPMILQRPVAFPVGGANWFLRKLIGVKFDKNSLEMSIVGSGSMEEDSARNDQQVSIELFLRGHKRYGLIHLLF